MMIVLFIEDISDGITPPYEPTLWYFPLLHFLDESGGEITPCTSNLGDDIDAFLYVDCEGFNDSNMQGVSWPHTDNNKIEKTFERRWTFQF